MIITINWATMLNRSIIRYLWHWNRNSRS